MTTRDQVVARLEALLRATPPPPVNAEPEDLIQQHAVLAAARAEILVELAVMSANVSDDARVRELFEALSWRDRAWIAALTLARGVVGERLSNLAMARRRASSAP